MNSKGVDRVISKLMLNSLYGKFGMSPKIDKMKVIDVKNQHKYIKDNDILDIIQL